MLEVWEKRTVEERNLFNPAFTGAIVFDFVKEHQKSRPMGASMIFLPLALAVALHKPTRERLPYSTVTSMYEWIQDNEDLRIGLDKRISGILPYVQEGTRFVLAKSLLEFTNGHHLKVSNSRAGFTTAFLKDATDEVRDIVKSARFLARWFAKSGSEETILAGWGVRP